MLGEFTSRANMSKRGEESKGLVPSLMEMPSDMKVMVIVRRRDTAV